MKNATDPWLEFIELARPAFDADHAAMVDSSLKAGEESCALDEALQAIVRFGGVEISGATVTSLRTSLWDDPERFELTHEYLDELERRAKN